MEKYDANVCIYNEKGSFKTNLHIILKFSQRCSYASKYHSNCRVCVYFGVQPATVDDDLLDLNLNINIRWLIRSPIC